MAADLIVRSVILFTRALLCIQAVFIATIAWAALLGLQPGDPRTPNIIAAMVASAVAAFGIAVAILMKRGRRWAAVSAFAAECAWTALALGSAALPPGPSRWQYLLGAALSLTAVTGLSLKPVRSYFAVARRPA
jgi:hypothetical protein